MSTIQIRTDIQILRQIPRQIQRQKQIKGEPETPIDDVIYFWKGDDKWILNMIR